jgi:hypothetical protein
MLAASDCTVSEAPGSSASCKANQATRLAALRVQVQIAGYQDYERTERLLQRLERLGRRIGAPGMADLAVDLRQTLYCLV